MANAATRREFFAVKTVAETLAGFRPARRTGGEAGTPHAGPRPRAALPLRPRAPGLLAAAGVIELEAHARPGVAIVSPGDEVVDPATAVLNAGQVRDACAVALAALVREAGGEPDARGIVPDDRDAL